jgi:hypothetical protein
MRRRNNTRFGVRAVRLAARFGWSRGSAGRAVRLVARFGWSRGSAGAPFGWCAVRLLRPQ